jgi:hypothetical protein
MVPIRCPKWPGWRLVLSGAPALLLLVCLFQLAACVTGMAVSRGRVECGFQAAQNHTVAIDCRDCSHRDDLDVETLALMLLGVVCVSVGVAASCFRVGKLARIYGFAMLLFATVCGITAVLTLLDSVVIGEAGAMLMAMADPDTVCLAHARSMQAATRLSGLLYILNAVAAAAGAILAIKTSRRFTFDEIATHHRAFHQAYDKL